MNYKLKADANGDVSVIFKTGRCYAVTLYPEGKCKALIESADEVKASTQFKGFGIEINDGDHFFGGEIIEDKPVAEVPKKTTKKKKAE